MPDNITQFESVGGFSGANLFVSGGATFSGTLTATTAAVGTNTTQVATTAFVQTQITASAVTTFNGRTGSVQGVSAAVAGTGISVSGATGAVTITNIGVQSFNGLTGAVGGVTTSAANTFTALQTFSSGINTASGTTFSGTVASDGGYRVTSNAINAQTVSYTLVAGDNGKIVTMNSASGITLTVPSGLPAGFNATIIQLGAGSVGFTSASGVTLNSFASSLNMAGQHGAATVISYATNIFNLSGTLTV